MQKCSYCGRENDDKARHCRECGTEFEQKSDLEAPELTRPSTAYINLDEVDDAFIVESGFSRPRWPVIFKTLRPFRPPDERRAAWLDVMSQWASRWESELGDEFWMTRSGSFFLVSALDGEAADRILQNGNARAEKIKGTLGTLAWEDRPYLLMVHVADERLANDFDDAVSVEDRDTCVGRVASDRSRCWFLLCDQREGVLTRDIDYQLVWNCLSHLPLLPRWLYTGLGYELFGPVTFDLDLVPEHRRFWNETNIQSFWAGTHAEEYENQKNLGYDLSAILVRLLCEKTTRLQDFIRCAHDYDAGQSAAHVLGIDLGELAGIFLGPGHWAPDPIMIAERWDSSYRGDGGEEE